MIFLVGLSVEVSRAAQTTFFLQNVGADKLPLVFVCFAAVMVTMSSVYAYVARKVPLKSLAMMALALATGATAMCWALIAAGFQNAVLAYALYCADVTVSRRVWTVRRSDRRDDQPLSRQ